MSGSLFWDTVYNSLHVATRASWCAASVPAFYTISSVIASLRCPSETQQARPIRYGPSAAHTGDRWAMMTMDGRMRPCCRWIHQTNESISACTHFISLRPSEDYSEQFYYHDQTRSNYDPIYSTVWKIGDNFCRNFEAFTAFQNLSLAHHLTVNLQ